jgi:hypothetical protein
LLVPAVTLNICDKPIVIDDRPTNAVLFVLIATIHLGLARTGAPRADPIALSGGVLSARGCGAAPMGGSAGDHHGNTSLPIG